MDGSGKQPFDRATAPYAVVAVRTDLPPAQQTVQACHAAMKACAGGALAEDTRLVLLGVPNRAALERLAERLAIEGARFALFEEPDHGIGASALATPPSVGPVPSALRKLPLWAPP